MFWYPSPDLCLDTILSRSSTDNSFDLMAWFLLWYALSTVAPYIDRCAFPNHAQSIEFIIGGLQSSCRNIKDDQWKQNAPELNSEVVKTYIQLFNFPKNLFLLCDCVVLCVDWWGKCFI
jgi:hypothetical protein